MKKFFGLLFFALFLMGCQDSAKSLTQEAERLEQTGNYKEVILVLNRAIALDSTYFLAYFNRAADKSALGRYESAIKDYEKVLELLPDNSLALFNIGNNLKRLVQNEKAIQYYEKSIGLDKDSHSTIVISNFMDPNQISMDDFFYERGLAYYELKYFKAAYEDFISISGGYQPAKVEYMIGISQLSMGKDPAGCASLRTAISLGHEEAKSVYNQYCK